MPELISNSNHVWSTSFLFIGITTMIVAGQLVLPSGLNQVRFEQGWLRIDANGLIAEVAMGKSPHTIDLGGDDWVISPGFIDTHVHLPQFNVVGHDGLTLLEWLDQSVFPEEARWADVSYAAKTTESVIRQLLSFGTTSFAAYATVHPDSAERAIEIAQAFGLRAAIGQVLMDRHAPVELLRPTDQLNFEATQLASKYPPARIVKDRTPQGKKLHRVEYAVTPRFAITCSERLMSQAGIIAKLFGSVVQTHLAENEPECRVVHELFPGETYTEVYEKAGLLGGRTLLGHGIFLAPSERKILRETRSVVCHCPTANIFLQSGIMPRALWKHEGLRVSLGSDIGAGTDRSMLRAAQAMIEIAKCYRMILRDGAASANPLHHLANEHVTVPNAAEAWWQITAGNAQAIGWDDVGELKANNSADLLLLQPDITFRNAYDPLATLFYNWDERWIKKVLVAGREVFKS